MKRASSSKAKTPFEKFHEQLKKQKIKQTSPQRPVNMLSFNQKQRKVYDLVVDKVTEKRVSEPLRLIVQGTAGTGKSALINAICTLLDKHKKRYSVCSFTGSSAYLVKGSTIHRRFHLPMYRYGSDPSTISETGKDLKNIDFFIFDEISLIGLNLFGFMSQRLKAVHNTDVCFGNRNILLFGDFSQLSPVGDRALFTSNPDIQLQGSDLEGHDSYQSFQKAVVLVESMRQAGPEQEGFRKMLMRIRRGELTVDDIEQLEKRYIRNLSNDELQEFTAPDVTVLFAERSAVDTYNTYRLGLLETEKVNIMPIQSRNAPPGCSEPLVLAVGARVYLTTNLAVEAGLFNGAMGVVTAFGPLRKDSKGPECVYVKFDNYTGKAFGERDDIPIIYHLGPVSSAVHGCTFTQEQIPLLLAFSLTVHKAQGTELRKVVLGIPEGVSRASLYFRFAPSIFFVALSRVKSLGDVAFSKPFRKELVVKEYPGLHLKDWLAEEQRLIEMESRM